MDTNTAILSVIGELRMIIENKDHQLNMLSHQLEEANGSVRHLMSENQVIQTKIIELQDKYETQRQ